jgi:hypothetical protein
MWRIGVLFVYLRGKVAVAVKHKLKIKVMKNKLNSIIEEMIFCTGLVVLGVVFIILTTNLHELCL